MRTVVFALPVIGAFAAILVGISRVPYPDAEFWRLRGHWIVWALVVGGFIPAVQTTIAEYGERLRRKELEREEHLRALLVSALVYVVRHCSAPWDLTGVQVFLRTGWLWRERHARAAKIRLASAPEAGVNWTKGKGVIGRCWETGTSHVARLDAPPFSDLGNIPAYRWPTVDAAIRYGLSHAEYHALRGKYGTVIAVPVVTGGTYRGCVTLDMPAGHRLIEEHRAVEILAATADLVRRSLER